MTVDELRARGECLCEELGRESFLTGAGLKLDSHFAAIFARYGDLAGDEALAAARGHPELYEWAVEIRVGRAVAALVDRLQAWESAAAITLPDGSTLPFQAVAAAIANEPDHARRLLLDRARRAILDEPAALRAERLSTECELLAALGLGDPVAARAALSGIDLIALGGQCARFLERTADVHRDTLRYYLRTELALDPKDAERPDAAYLFRGVGYDEFFPARDLVLAARRQVSELGFDLGRGGRIRFDTEARERKRPRAFCAPVRIPDEVYLVIRPMGGHQDYRAFWHELGHALHFTHTERSLPLEHRWLGDNSVTEGFASLFEHMLLAPRWLERYAGLRGARLRDFLRAQTFARLALVRRYAAKLRYELELFRSPSLEGGARRYVEVLTGATGFRHADEDALLDLDDGFYAARYLRAWQLEAGLSAALVERYDDDWFRNPKAGPFLAELLAQGQRHDAQRLAAAVLGQGLEFAPLVSRFDATLA